MTYFHMSLDFQSSDEKVCNKDHLIAGRN